MNKIMIPLFVGMIIDVSANSVGINFCSSGETLTGDQIWKVFAFNDFQIYFILTIGIISALLLILSLLSWFYLPSLALPLDIIIIILSGTLLDNLTLIIQAIYSKIHQDNPSPSDFTTFCNSVGTLSLLGHIISLFYNAFFCGALAYTILNTLRKPLFSPQKQHLICLFITIIALLVVIFTNSDQPFNYMCTYRIPNSSSLGLVLLHIILTIFSFIALKKFKHNIPQNSFFQQHSHFKYYFVYMITFCVFEATNSLIFLIGTITCSSSNSDRNSILEILFTISNCMTIVLAFASVALRLAHPLFFKKLKKVKDYSQITAQQHSHDQQQFHIVSSLLTSIKGSQIISFISAIMMNYIEHIKKHPASLNPYHFQRHYSFNIDQDVTQEYTRRRITNRESHFARQEAEGLVTLKYQVKIFNPEYYSWVLRADKINLFLSFDLRKNLYSVKQQSYAQGGKSRQFFYATYDHKFLFKTIQSQQVSACIAKTQSFYNYFHQHPVSLIVKNLGLFRFQRQDIQNQKINLLIMKNLTSASKSQTLRTYDIKGTLNNRHTMKQKRIKETDQVKLRTYTLKDNDFKILEQRLDFDQGQRKEIKDILERDINFLSQLGIINYSLLIIKRAGAATHQFGQYKSIRQNEVYYHIGIIDYLQEWNNSKKATRVFKTLITYEQATVNSPEAYSQRLLTFISSIL